MVRQTQLVGSWMLPSIYVVPSASLQDLPQGESWRGQSLLQKGSAISRWVRRESGEVRERSIWKGFAGSEVHYNLIGQCRKNFLSFFNG